jgi:hypothetical protein
MGSWCQCRIKWPSNGRTIPGMPLKHRGLRAVVSLPEPTTLRRVFRGSIAQLAKQPSHRAQGVQMMCAHPRGLRLVLMLIACALGLALPSISLAASAPMCDELAQSIEAPPTIWPHRGGSIRAVSQCPDTGMDVAPGAPRRIDGSFRLSPREAPLATILDVCAPRSQRLVVPQSWAGDCRPGHTQGIYRPPRAKVART